MGSHCCGPGPDVARLQGRQRQVLVIVLLVNAATFVMMLVAALRSGSTSLLSGGLDNFGDALTYALSLAVVASSARAKARVAMLKALLILGAAIAVGVQIVVKLRNPEVPLLETMSMAALFNLWANGLCLYLLSPYRHGDINMASSWECSRNDVFEGLAVLAAAGGVWLLDSGWPDLVIASALLVMFLRSALRVALSAWAQLQLGEA